MLWAAAFMVGLHSPCTGQPLAPAPGGVPLSTLKEIERTGMELFVLDRAASLAAGALEKVRGFKRDRRVKGWITEEVSSGIIVSFVGSKGKAPLSVLYRATVSRSGRIQGSPAQVNTPVALTEDQSAQFQVRSLGLSSVDAPCTKSYKAVVLPRASATANWVVYALPEAAKPRVFPVGGSYRFEIDPARTSVVSSRGFARTCIDLSGPQELVAFSLSHILDPNPTEIHVFANLSSGTPIYLVTMDNNVLWKVDQGVISFVKPIEGKG